MATGHGTIEKVEAEVKEKAFTAPQPFNLTKPSPKETAEVHCIGSEI